MEELAEHFHPMIVHFPIALLLSAVALDLAALIFRRPGLHRVALWNLCLGTLGAGVAVWSGLEASEVAKHSFEIWKVMSLHQRLGQATLALGVLGCAIRLPKRDQLSGRVRLLTIALAMGMAGTLSYGAYLGGRMVYEFGVGR